jgi:exopolysaccharide biosynthesis polyprenyl glycosylphosphotransferase
VTAHDFASASAPARTALAPALAGRCVLLLSDMLAVTLALTTLSAIRPEHAGLLPWALLTLPLWAFVLHRRPLEDDAAIGNPLQDLPRLLLAVTVGTLGVAATAETLTADSVEPSALLMFAGFAGSALVVMRTALQRRVRALVAPVRVLVIGRGHAADLFTRAVRGLRHDAVVEQRPPLDEVPGLDFATMLGPHRVGRVVIPEWQVDRDALPQLLQVARERRVEVSLLPTHFEALGTAGAVGRLEGRMLLRDRAASFPRPARVLKRVMDFAGATILMVCTAPLLAAVAIAVKLDSPGPVLFRQRRVGKGGEVFSVLKFRTMVEGAERFTDCLLARSRDAYWLLLDDDPRLTRLGRFLRRSSLDELPQLWNVLKGDMSLVGPRPLIEREHALVPEWARRRTDVLPGLTGLWQVRGRTSLSFEQMLGLDCLYVRSWSIWGDMQLMLCTIPAVLTRRGAN